MRVGIVSKPGRGFASATVCAFVLAVIGFGVLPAAPAEAATALPQVYVDVLVKADKLFRQMEDAADDDCVTDDEYEHFREAVNDLVENGMNPLASRSDVNNHFSDWPDADYPYYTASSTPDGELEQAAQDLYNMLDDLPRCRLQVEIVWGGFYRDGQEIVPSAVHLFQPVQPYYHWTGFYAGAHVLGEFSTVNTREIFPPTGLVTSFLSDTGGGFGGGVDFGYNCQPFNNRWIVGGVVKLNGLNDNVTHFFDSGTSIGSTIDFSGSALLNGGYLVTPRLLLFGQAGVSVADQDLHINFGGPVTDAHRFTPGVTAGLGAEYMLPRGNLPFLGKQTSLYINFDQTWYAPAKLDMPTASPSFDYKWTRITDEIDLGVHVRF